jgi:hypothetical protein
MIEFHDLSPLLRAFIIVTTCGFIGLAIGVVMALDTANDAWDRSIENINRIANLKRKIDE